LLKTLDRNPDPEAQGLNINAILSANIAKFCKKSKVLGKSADFLPDNNGIYYISLYVKA
jgi:hypothetical protein